MISQLLSLLSSKTVGDLNQLFHFDPKHSHFRKPFYVVLLNYRQSDPNKSHCSLFLKKRDALFI